MRGIIVLLALFGAAASARLPKGTCTTEHVDNARTLLQAAFTPLDVMEHLPLPDVDGPVFSLSAGNLSGLQSLKISEDVKSLCDANKSITDFVAVANKVTGHYIWNSERDNTLSGQLRVEGLGATFTGRMRQAGSTVRSVSLFFSHFNSVSVHLDGMSNFSVPGAKLLAMGNREFQKAVRKTTKNFVSPALKKALVTRQ